MKLSYDIKIKIHLSIKSLSNNKIIQQNNKKVTNDFGMRIFMEN
jgi:hypothetical protein